MKRKKNKKNGRDTKTDVIETDGTGSLGDNVEMNILKG